MPKVRISLKKSIHCKPVGSDVANPKARNSNHQHSINDIPRKAPGSGCSRSMSNLKDLLHGCKRHTNNVQPANCNSPMSIGSSDFLNPITHEVIISNSSKCELKVTGFASSSNVEEKGAVGSTSRPGTPCRINRSRSSASQRHSPLNLLGNSSPSNEVFGIGNGNGNSNLVSSAVKSSADSVCCHRCGEQFGKWEILEAHHLSKHAVTELVEGDSSRKIVEIICRARSPRSKNIYIKIERVLKVHNLQKTITQFEEYRELVKENAANLPKKHPRCLADGNELLRFYSATISCSLGTNESSSLCLSEKCDVCHIMRHGFEIKKGEIGVFTSSTCGRAYEMINSKNVKKILVVCRVVAGRVHRPVDDIKELIGLSGFDSVAGKVGLYSNVEELYLLNPKALLPCFVVICRS